VRATAAARDPTGSRGLGFRVKVRVRTRARARARAMVTVRLGLGEAGTVGGATRFNRNGMLKVGGPVCESGKLS